MLKSFGAMSNSRSEAESRRFDLTAGTAYGLIFGLCFGLYVWGRDGWLLAQTGADLAWSKLFIGLPLVLFICCLAGFLSALSASALFPVLIWSVAGVVLGILVGRIPYNAPNLTVWLLDQRLWGIPVFPYTHAGRMLMGIAAVVGAVLGAMVGLLQVFAQEWAWDRSGSKNRMTLAAWLVLWVSLPLAILFASIVDGEINKPIRGLQTSTGKIISLALSGGDDQELVQTVEGYRAVQPFVDRFTQDYVIHLSDYDTQTLLSGYTDIAFSNGFLLRCAVTRVASYSGVLHRVLTCYDLSQRLADRIEDLVYAGLKGERRWLADDMRAMVVKDTAFNWLRSQKSNLSPEYHWEVINQHGDWISTKISFNTGLEMNCLFRGLQPLVLEKCQGDVAQKDALVVGAKPTDQPTAEPLPGIATIPVSDLGSDIPWLPRDESSIPAVSYIGFNSQRSPLDDPRLRQALSLSVDRQALAVQVMQVNANRALPKMTFVLPPGENFAGPQDYDKWRVPVIQAYIAQVLMSNLSYQRPRAATNITHPDVLGRDLYGEVGLPFDPEKARQVFARAGYAHDQTLSLKFISQDTEMHRAILNSMATTWRDVLGIEVELQFFDQDTYLEQLENHDFDLYFKGWIAEYNDPDGFLSTPFRYSNPKSTSKEFDDFFGLIDQATELVDEPGERQAIYIRAERLLNEEETLVIPVLHHYIEY